MELSGQALAGVLNHLISQTPGGASKLVKHAGEKLAIDALIVRNVFLIGEDGYLAAVGDAAAEATIRLTPDLLSRLPFAGKDAFRGAQTEGDAELLSAFNDVFQHMQWDVEADLARLFGPVIGYRLAEAGRSLAGWIRQASVEGAKTLAEYVTEENPMLATPLAIREFNAAVDTLRDDVERLEARLARLEKSA
jgi:ubiquinone biosynthesis accessory factor UbiJ